MTLELDTRQRAMLQEMGVHVWLPESGVAILSVPAPAAAMPAAVAPPRPPAAPQRPPAPVTPAAVVVPVSPSTQPVPTGTAAPDAASLDWTELTETVQSCQACGLCAGAAKQRRHSLQALSQSAQRHFLGLLQTSSSFERHSPSQIE